jgi:hypothetical protein
MAAIPSSFSSQYVGGKTIAVGTPPTSGNLTAPMGSWLSALGNINPASTPADRVGDSHVTLSCQNLLAHDASHPQLRPASARYRVCRGSTVTNDPTFRNSDSTDMVAFDAITACAWVQTGSKEGLVMFGQIADVVPGINYGSDNVPHMWYGPMDNPCAHGQNSTVGSGTGPKCGSMVPYTWIYSADSLGQAARGAVHPGTVVEAYSAPLHNIAPTIAYPIVSNFTLGGAAFDAASGLLFLCEIQADRVTNPYEPRPVIHVFEIAGGGSGTGGTVPQAPQNLRII